MDDTDTALGLVEEYSTNTDDFGESTDKYDTLGGYNRYEVSSVMQKCIRRSQPEGAAWAAWELARSGYGWNLWDRLKLYIIEDTAAGEDALLDVRVNEIIANYKYSTESKIGQIAAVRAAISLAEARSSREGLYGNGYFLRVVLDHANEDKEPDYDIPLSNSEQYRFESEDSEVKDDSDEKQSKFGEGGELETEYEGPTTHFGNPIHNGETMCEFDAEKLQDRFVEACYEGAEEDAAFCAWDLAWSGYGKEMWNYLFACATVFGDNDGKTSQIINRYERLATNHWEYDGWGGRVCAIHGALAVARTDNERRATELVEHFDDVAPKRAEQIEGDGTVTDDFPIPRPELKPSGKYSVCLDKHTYIGKQVGRGFRHFMVHGARVGPEGENGVAEEWNERLMRLEEYGYRDADETNYSDEEIDHSAKGVDMDDPWTEPDVSD